MLNFLIFAFNANIVQSSQENEGFDIVQSFQENTDTATTRAEDSSSEDSGMSDCTFMGSQSSINSASFSDSESIDSAVFSCGSRRRRLSLSNGSDFLEAETMDFQLGEIDSGDDQSLVKEIKTIIGSPTDTFISYGKLKKMTTEEDMRMIDEHIKAAISNRKAKITHLNNAFQYEKHKDPKVNSCRTVMDRDQCDLSFTALKLVYDELEGDNSSLGKGSQARIDKSIRDICSHTYVAWFEITELMSDLRDLKYEPIDLSIKVNMGNPNILEIISSGSNAIQLDTLLCTVSTNQIKKIVLGEETDGED